MISIARLKNKLDFLNWFKKITNKTKPITLGRWSNENLKKTNLKIDYANEDHCGVCQGLINNSNVKEK